MKKYVDKNYTSACNWIAQSMPSRYNTLVKADRFSKDYWFWVDHPGGDFRIILFFLVDN